MRNCQSSRTLRRAPDQDHPFSPFRTHLFRLSLCPVDQVLGGRPFAGCFRVGGFQWLAERQRAPCGPLRASCRVCLSPWVILPLCGLLAIDCRRGGRAWSLAGDTVPVAIKAATVSRFAVVDRGDTSGARGIAVGVIGFGPSATVIGGLRGDRRRGGAVAVVPP